MPGLRFAKGGSSEKPPPRFKSGRPRHFDWTIICQSDVECRCRFWVDAADSSH
jgi:hypothetical protein